MDVQNTVDFTTLEGILKTKMGYLLAHPEAAQSLAPVFIWGSPGVGKSSLIKRVCADLGIGFIDFRLSQREPVDLRGLPVPNKETQTVDWFVTGDFPQDKDSAGIILFDELPAADRSLQVASYEIILDRTLGRLYRLPDKWMVVAAGNLATDRAVSTAVSSALANRFQHFTLETSVEDWLDWGATERVAIHPVVMGFLRYRPDSLFSMKRENLQRGFPTPRAWERVSTELKLFESVGAEIDVIQRLVFGLVGVGCGNEFMAYYKRAQRYANILDVMRDPRKSLALPTRADELYAIVAALTYYVWRGKTPEEEQRRLSGFYRIVNSLPADFASLAMTSALGYKADAVQILFRHSGYATWREKFGASLKRYVDGGTSASWRKRLGERLKQGAGVADGKEAS